MTDLKKRLFFNTLGLIFSTLPPFFAVLSYFPIWRERGAEAVLSGLSLCLILICAVPLIRTVKKALCSPSAPLIWFFVFILFFALSRIAEDITVIAFVGFISNLFGAIFFAIARRSQRGENEK